MGTASQATDRARTTPLPIASTPAHACIAPDGDDTCKMCAGEKRLIVIGGNLVPCVCQKLDVPPLSAAILAAWENAGEFETLDPVVRETPTIRIKR